MQIEFICIVRRQSGRCPYMFWLVVLSTVVLVGAMLFVLTRDAFRAFRLHRETPLAASPVKKSSDAKGINAMMQEKLPVPPPFHPAALFSGQCRNEADALADTQANLQNTPIMLNETKTYLRLEEHDDSLERLLFRRIPGAQAHQEPPREFSIGVTEKKKPPLEHE